MPEIINIFWGTVSYRAFHVIPRILVGVKLRGISGEVVGMNTPVGFDEPLNRSGFMSGAPIPDKNKAPLEIFKEVPQKGIDLGMPDILGDMKTDVKTNSLSLGRDTDGRDRGYLRPSASHSKDRRLAARRPGFPDRWDKQKPALVEEDKGDFKPFGLFLYAAMNSVSIFLYSSHPVLWLVSRASDSSNPNLEGFSRHGRGDTQRRSSYLLPWRFSSESKVRLCNPASRAQLRESLQGSASVARLAAQGVRERVSTSMPLVPSFFLARSSNKPSLVNNLSFLPHPADLNLYPAAQRLAGGAVQAVLGSHGVSWNQFSLFLLLMQMSIECVIALYHRPYSHIDKQFTVICCKRHHKGLQTNRSIYNRIAGEDHWRGKLERKPFII